MMKLLFGGRKETKVQCLGERNLYLGLEHVLYWIGLDWTVRNYLSLSLALLFFSLGWNQSQ